MLPSMSPPDPIAYIVRRLEAIERLVAELATSTGTWGSATVGRGGVNIRDGGGLRVLDGGSVSIDEGGAFDTLGALRARDSITRNTTMYFGALEPADTYRSGLLVKDPENEEVLFWLAKLTNGSREMVSAAALERIILRAKSMTLHTTANEMPIFGLPTTSAGSNVYLGTVNGKFTLAWVTSSRRYKQDVRDAPIDPAAALSWRPRVWRDRNDVSAIGDEAKWHVGFIAEEVDQVSPEFVVRDDEGRPDSLSYDRMVAGLTLTVQAQQEQIDVLTDATTALAARLDAAVARIEALEAAP